MSAKFIKMVSDIQFERFNIHLAEMAKNKTACGIFFGFDFNPQAVAANVQALRNIPLNVTCAVVLVDTQANVLKNLTFSRENSPASIGGGMNRAFFC